MGSFWNDPTRSSIILRKWTSGLSAFSEYHSAWRSDLSPRGPESEVPTLFSEANNSCAPNGLVLKSLVFEGASLASRQTKT